MHYFEERMRKIQHLILSDRRTRFFALNWSFGVNWIHYRLIVICASWSDTVLQMKVINIITKLMGQTKIMHFWDLPLSCFVGDCVSAWLPFSLSHTPNYFLAILFPGRQHIEINGLMFICRGGCHNSWFSPSVLSFTLSAVTSYQFISLHL